MSSPARPSSNPLADGAAATSESAACRVRLRRGTPLLMRPIRGEDKPLLLDFFRRQSPEARYMRFMGGIAELSESTLRDLTEVDHVNHEAWIAIDGGARDRPCVGVARYVRLAKAPRDAEVAVAVVDSHQRLGIGSALLERVAGSAAANGIETFHSCVFDSNLAVIGILQRHGATMTGRDGGVLRFSVPVPGAVSPVVLTTGDVGSWRHTISSPTRATES